MNMKTVSLSLLLLVPCFIYGSQACDEQEFWRSAHVEARTKYRQANKRAWNENDEKKALSLRQERDCYGIIKADLRWILGGTHPNKVIEHRHQHSINSSDPKIQEESRCAAEYLRSLKQKNDNLRLKEAIKIQLRYEHVCAAVDTAWDNFN